MKPLLKWSDLTTKQIGELDRNTVVIIPTGALESHGNHLTVATDIEIAQTLSLMLTEHSDSILFPTLCLGPCETLLHFPGTVTISEETYYHYLEDVVSSIVSHSFFRIFFVNGHGGNTVVLKKIISAMKERFPKLDAHYFNWFELPYIEVLKKEDPTYRGDHGDRLETEMMLMSKPTSVVLSEAIDDLPQWPYNAELLTDYSGVMTHSVEGFPSFASVDTAKKHFLKIKHYLINAFGQYYGIRR